MESFAALSWQNQFYRLVSQSLRLRDSDEIRMLDLKAKALRSLRRNLVSEKFD